MRENEKKNINITPNLGTVERVLSLMGGSYMLYDALAKRNKSFMESIVASYLLFRGGTGYCPVYETMVPGKEGKREKRINISTSLVVNKPRNEVYSFWRKLENLPLFMDHLEEVTTMDNTKSKWRAKVPGGMGSVSWEAVIVEEDENKRIKWKSVPGSTIKNEGEVRFRDARQSGTEVDVNISYNTPLGAPGDEIAKLFSPVFKNMVKKDVEGFKSYMETGEVPTGKAHASAKSS